MGLSDESIKSSAASNISLAPALNYINTKIKVKFNGNCLKQENVTFTHKIVVIIVYNNIYNVYEINLWSLAVGNDFALRNSLFGAVNLPNNPDPNEYKYSGYGIRFDAHASFSLSEGSGFCKNVIVFGVDMSSSVHFDNRKKIFILDKVSMQGLNDSTLTTEKEYFKILVSNRKHFCLRLHYNVVNSYIFVNNAEIYKLKAKDSEINAATLCLGNV